MQQAMQPRKQAARSNRQRTIQIKQQPNTVALLSSLSLVQKDKQVVSASNA